MGFAAVPNSGTCMASNFMSVKEWGQKDFSSSLRLQAKKEFSLSRSFTRSELKAQETDTRSLGI